MIDFDLIASAFTIMGLRGNVLQQQLARPLMSKWVARNGRDPMCIVAPTGAGKTSVAGVCHTLLQTSANRSGPLVRIPASHLRTRSLDQLLYDPHHNETGETKSSTAVPPLLTTAIGGTLLLEGVQEYDETSQRQLQTLLQEWEFANNTYTTHMGCKQELPKIALLLTTTGKGAGPAWLKDCYITRLNIPAFSLRPADIQEMATFFVGQTIQEVGQELGANQEALETPCTGLTRRALADIEAVMVQHRVDNVRRLKEILRDIIFDLGSATPLPEALSSADVLPYFHKEFAVAADFREQQDRFDLFHHLDTTLDDIALGQLAERHHLPAEALTHLVQGVAGMIDAMDDRPRTYRNVIERTNRLAKVALWLTTKATTQAQFRKYFGGRSEQMPTKSVAHQVYYEVYPKGDL